MNVTVVNTHNMLSKHGPVLFTLSESKSVACVKSNVRNLGGPATSHRAFLRRLLGKIYQLKEGCLMGSKPEEQGVRSPHSSPRRSGRSHCEGSDRVAYRIKETVTGDAGSDIWLQTSLHEISNDGCLDAYGTTVSAPEEPCAGKPHAGIREGTVGQLAVLPRFSD